MNIVRVCLFWDVCARVYKCKKRVFIGLIKFKRPYIGRSIIEKVGKEREKLAKGCEKPRL